MNALPQSDPEENDVQRLNANPPDSTRAPPFDRHLLIIPDVSHSLLTESLVINPNEIREELSYALGSKGEAPGWMNNDDDIEDESVREILAGESYFHGKHTQPSDPNDLEAGILLTLSNERRDTTAASTSRQEKFSSFVMDVSLRIAGSSRPGVDRHQSTIRSRQGARLSIETRQSLDESLSRVRSHAYSNRTGRTSFAHDPQSTFKHDQSNINQTFISTQNIEKSSLTEEPYEPDYSYYLYGNSLMLFSPKSKFRRVCFSIISHKWVSPIILALIFLQTALLAYRQWNPNGEDGYLQYGYDWADYTICGINCIYTLEILAKIISFGLINDRAMFETLGISYQKSRISYAFSYLWRQVYDNISFFSLKELRLKMFPRKSSQKAHSRNGASSIMNKYNVSEVVEILESSTPIGADYKDDQSNRSEIHIEDLWELDRKLALMNVNRAYLRKNGHRLDFASVLFFWISLPLSLTGWDKRTGFMLFRSLSALRILRLCNLTHGTNVILRMFQAALPQLVDVGIFISCFWVIFGIIGVQSFLGSFSRTCVWTNPNNSLDTFHNEEQFCGSFLSLNGTRLSYVDRDGEMSFDTKGFTCPINSECRSGENPFNGTVNFDNILQSMQLVFVIMSINTFAETMYQMMDSEGILASLYFIFSIFILTVWLMNLFIAIIVTSFHTAHEEAQSRRAKLRLADGKFSKAWPISSDFSGKKNQEFINKLPLLKLYYRAEIGFILLVFASLIVQCWRTYGMSAQRAHTIYRLEAAFTCVFLAEIVLRFVLHFPYWRVFFHSKRNLFDLFLAVITSIIILGPVKTKLGEAYYWLTAFQLLRFYRVVFSLRWTGKLLYKVMRNLKAILDLALFFFILLGLAGIIISRFFEGTVPKSDREEIIYTMHTLPNTLMSMYVITSTAGWANIMYKLQTYATSTIQRSVGSILLILWFIISNFVLMNIFIAIIEHALSDSHDGQRRHQLAKFISDMTKKLLTVRSTPGYLRRLREKIFKRDSETTIDVTVTHLLLSGAAVNDFAESHFEKAESTVEEDKHRSDYYVVQFMEKVREFVLRPFNNPFYSHTIEAKSYEVFDPAKFASEVIQQRKALVERQDQYLREHPTYNYVFYILSPRHPLRRFCQKIVKLSYGERIEGVEPNKLVNDIFSVVMFLSSVLIVVTTCYLTPLKRKELNQNTGVWNWGVYVDFSFLIIFGSEFLIKITADGLVYTPNAYVRSPWNCLDFIAFASIFIEFIAFVLSNGKLSRIIRGLKALRALRLLTVSETAKNNFHYTLISGFGKILSSAMVAVALIFPFSIWGLNVFNGKLGHCNNHSMNQTQCINEYEAEVFKWEVMSPMVYKTPFLSMNNFRRSFSTFYQITSQEGWPELLQDVMKSTGIGTPQHLFARPFNGFMIILFNFVGTVFILTLFVSVIISNYSKLTGRAYLTDEQIQWYHIKRYLSRIKPSIRRNISEMDKFSRFCYKLTVEKNKVWRSFLNAVLLIHVVDLLLEAFPSVANIYVRFAIFVFTTTCFAVDSTLHLIGLGVKRFVKNRWNVVAFVLTWAAFITSTLFMTINFDSVFYNFYKTFLIALLMFLFPRSDRLSQLLKFASASFPSLFSMMFTWLIVFLVYGIAMNQIFGLTKFGIHTSSNINLRTIPKSLILLFRMSFGEEWNFIMEDFLLEPPFCTSSVDADGSDCGSKPYGYILFMSWNIISMYIMLSLYISLVLDTFSYIAGGSKQALLIKRTEVTKFKNAWRKFDPYGSGIISFDDLPSFLRCTEGSLAVPAFTEKENEEKISTLKEKWFTKSPNKDVYDYFVNYGEINKYLESRKPSLTYSVRERFLEEAKMRMELYGGKGIKFQDLILQIPLYTSFEADQCLVLADFLEQRLFLKRLELRLKKRRALELLSGFVCRRRFMRYRNGELLKDDFLAKFE